MTDDLTRRDWIRIVGAAGAAGMVPAGITGIGGASTPTRLDGEITSQAQSGASVR